MTEDQFRLLMKLGIECLMPSAEDVRRAYRAYVEKHRGEKRTKKNEKETNGQMT